MTPAVARSVFGWALLAAALGWSTAVASDADAEARVLAYIRAHVEPGRPLLVTELYNTVFTQPEERKALDKLYKAFFRIPLFVAQHQGEFGAPPKLQFIAEQFDLRSAEDADTLLRVMESDPRVPRFIQRDPRGGEIIRVDTEMIRTDPRFGQATEKALSGWEGKAAPDFALPGFNKTEVTSASLRGKTVLVYVWFTGCPPCMKQTPELVLLQREFGDREFLILAANADKFLGLDYDDNVRGKYLAEQKVIFPVAHWTREADAAFGSISIFPTLFLIDSKGVIMQHWVGYTSAEMMRAALAAALTQP